ncbi:MAG: hypothetical protein KDI88_10465 [Gammaproteobacteria bacterium]|nr:hypothetical protein [Gammaproteobacteria bacterium]
MNAAAKNGLVIVLVLASGALAFYGARTWQLQRDHYAVPALAGGCPLANGSCRQPLAEGAVTLEIDPAAIPLMQTLTLTVRAEGLNVDAVSVDIRGLNMDMGLNRTRLRHLGGGRWQGETILPVCSQRRMEWEARVQVDGAQRIAVPFLFFTERP